MEDVEVTDDDHSYSSQDEMLNGVQASGDESDLDSDEERERLVLSHVSLYSFRLLSSSAYSEVDLSCRYDAELEEYLEHAYDKFRAAKDGSTKRRKRARLADEDHQLELWQVGSFCSEGVLGRT